MTAQGPWKDGIGSGLASLATLALATWQFAVGRRAGISVEAIEMNVRRYLDAMGH